MNTLKKAATVAANAHKGQMYGNYPYYLHLGATYTVAKHFGLSEGIQVACFLHDALEDTDISYAFIKESFGDVADMVLAVTDDPFLKPRAERKKDTYKRIGKYGETAKLLKLCDRVANVEACFPTGLNPSTRKLEMYKAEHPEFYTCIKTLKGHPLYHYYISLIHEEY